MKGRQIRIVRDKYMKGRQNVTTERFENRGQETPCVQKPPRIGKCDKLGHTCLCAKATMLLAASGPKPRT